MPEVRSKRALRAALRSSDFILFSRLEYSCMCINYPELPVKIEFLFNYLPEEVD